MKPELALKLNRLPTRDPVTYCMEILPDGHRCNAEIPLSRKRCQACEKRLEEEKSSE